MNNLFKRFLRIFGSKNRYQTTTYELSPYSPAYHPRLVVRKHHSVAGWVKVSGVSMVLLFTVAGYTGWRSLSEVVPIYAMQKSSAQPYELTSQTKLKTDASGKTNVLLLGVAGVGQKGADLTDMMTILQVDAVTKRTSYIVMPRKLIVHSPSAYFGEWQALNVLYSSGKYNYLHKADAASDDPLAKQAGFNELDQAITTITGMTIHYNVLVDYAALAHAIDSVGGISIVAPKRMADRPLMKESGNKGWIVAQRGEQILTGKQAILYARTFAGENEKTRETARLERQLQILKAYVKKLSSVGIVTNPSGVRDIVDSFGASFYSDMKPGESLLAAQSMFASDMRYSGALLYDASDAQSPFKQIGTARNDQLEPKAGRTNYDEVQSYLVSRMNGSVPTNKEFAILE